MMKKTGKIYLEYEHLECDPVSYKIKCSTKNCLTRLNNKLEETFRYYDRYEAEYLKLLVFSDGDIYIDYDENKDLIFLMKLGNLLSSLTKEKLESLLNDLFFKE